MPRELSVLAKLTRGEARRILSLWQEGSSYDEILKLYPYISQATLTNLMGGRCYRAITKEWMAEQGLETLRPPKYKAATSELQKEADKCILLS